MDKRIDKGTGFSFAADVNEELRPDARLDDMGQTEDKEADNSEFLNGYFQSLSFQMKTPCLIRSIYQKSIQ
ncbi:MAG: hypothetical protein H8F28_25380 [Fibrella sp.]|nr:hypothetical protein [Armatimonadota bacterium]